MFIRVDLWLPLLACRSALTKTNYIVVTNPPPVFSISPGSLAFGNLIIGQTNFLNFQITNSGAGTLAWSLTPVRGCTQLSRLKADPRLINAGVDEFLVKPFHYGPYAMSGTMGMYQPGIDYMTD